MIHRKLYATVERALAGNPAVVLTGARQVGKTTLARAIAEGGDAVYVDLERPSDAAKLSDVESYCNLHAGRLVILDEVQRLPNLFATLRSVIDERRRAGLRYRQFLLLGSASIELLRQSSETLAGRVAACELCPFGVDEAGPANAVWLRGGFPESFLAEDDERSLEWRLEFVASYLQRDLPSLGPRIPAETLRRFWTMLAHNQGQTFNAALLARGLDVSGTTVGRYLDLLVDLLLVRRLPPWISNLGKRLVKAPKTYVRDSGICHALLGLGTTDALLGHPVAGASWEGFVIENIARALPKRAACGFYRTAGGAEVDLVVDVGGGELWAVEVKRSTAPKVSKGFYHACEDLRPKRKLVVHAGSERFPLGHGIEAVSLPAVVEEARAA